MAAVGWGGEGHVRLPAWAISQLMFEGWVRVGQACKWGESLYEGQSLGRAWPRGRR